MASITSVLPAAAQQCECLSPDQRRAPGAEYRRAARLAVGSLTRAGADPVLKEALGPTIYETFTRAKWAEIEEYRMKITDWEIERYLEQA